MAQKAPIYIIVAILLTAAFCALSGCSEERSGTSQANKPDLGAASGAEAVEIMPSGAETPSVVLSDASEVKAFTDALDIEDWKPADKPQDQNALCKVRLLGTETAKLGEPSADKQPQEVGLITVLADEPAICFSASGIDLYFEIPRESYSYLLEEGPASS